MHHDDHDSIFGGKRVYLVCLAIWLIAVGCRLPDIIGSTGQFGWTGNAFVCDIKHANAECNNVGPFINHIINITVVIVFYSAVIINMVKMRHKVYVPDEAEYTELIKSISLTLLLLTITYLAFLLPLMIFERCTVVGPQSIDIQSGVASWYWWLYGVNFLTYLTTNRRIRAAYRKFFEDVRVAVCGPRSQTPGVRSPDTSSVSRQEMRDMSSEDSALRKDFPQSDRR